MVAAVRVEPVEVVYEVRRVRGVAGDQVVVGGDGQRNVQCFSELGGLAKVGVTDNALCGTEVVAPVNRNEHNVDSPLAEHLDQTFVDHGVARVVDGDAVPLDDVAEVWVS